MAMTRRVLRVQERQSGSLKVVRKELPSKPAVAGKVLRDAESFRRALPDPKRTQLTKREWEERGDLVKMAKLIEYEGAGALSLDDLCDVQESIRRCTNLRLFQLYT